jgi:FkbM family methyltransferase
MSYENLINIRHKDESTGFEVDQYDWYWIKADTGAWEGPRTDWEYHHKRNYFLYVQKYDVVVQAGGCQGMYPRMLATRFKQVYTFEPDPLSFYVLVNNTQLDNVHAFNAGLGEIARPVRVNRAAADNVGMNTVIPDDCGGILQLTVDSLGLLACDLLLLDIEGYELKALHGARDTIARFHPVVSVENATDQIRDFLINYGYKEACQSVSDTIFIPV